MPGVELLLPANSVFHHIGYATESVAKERVFFRSLGYTQESDTFQDDVQGVAGCFMVGAGPRIELLENLPGSTRLSPWLETGVKMYHMAYEVEDIELCLERFRAEGARIVVEPISAVAFAGRRVAFIMTRNRQMLELIEWSCDFGGCDE